MTSAGNGIIVSPTAGLGTPIVGGGGGGGGGSGGTGLNKRKAGDILDQFGVLNDIRELLIFYYWTLSADIGQISRLNPLANSTAMAAFNVTCSPISCDQQAFHNTQTPSTNFTNYLCSETRSKTPLALFISVMVANIVLLSTGYQIIFIMSSVIAKRRDSNGTKPLKHISDT